MKKTVALLLTAALAVSSVSCGNIGDMIGDMIGKSPKPKDNDSETTDETTAVERKKNLVPENASPDACGDNLTWHFDEDTSTLYIEGKGDMWDFVEWDEETDDYYAVDTPWSIYYYDITNIEIADSVTSIGDYAFSWCESLTSIDVDSDNNYYCDKSDVLFTKDKKTLICYPAGKKDTEYAIPDSVISIGDSAFFWCESLTSIDIPDSVTSIGNNAFSWCESLTSIDISDSVAYIGDSAFSWCTSLTSIDIPDSVISIGDEAFRFCDALTSIDVPDSITSIGDSAFAWCFSLETINFAGTEEQWNSFGLDPYDINDATVIFGK